MRPAKRLDSVLISVPVVSESAANGFEFASVAGVTSAASVPNGFSSHVVSTPTLSNGLATSANGLGASDCGAEVCDASRVAVHNCSAMDNYYKQYVLSISYIIYRCKKEHPEVFFLYT